jgi:16S rRNA processing protein RimM
LKRADLVGIGTVLRSQGNKGQVKLRLREREIPEITWDRVYLLKKGGDFEEFEVESFELDRHSVFLKLKGVDTLTGADILAGREVYVPEACFRPPAKGRYYDFQVIGSRVLTVSGAEVGTVAAVVPAGSGILLLVAAAGREIYVPFTEAICRSIDPEKKEIVIDPPDGLLELNEI